MLYDRLGIWGSLVPFRWLSVKFYGVVLPATSTTSSFPFDLTRKLLELLSA